MKQFKKKQDGFVLLTALLILVILILIAISASVVGSTNSIAANSNALQKQAYQAALSGNDYLMAKINGSDTEFNVLKSKHCSSSFDQQYTSSSIISEGSDPAKRQIDIFWYACTAVSGGTPVTPSACPSNGECISVIISGVACPKGVAVSAKNCSIVRYLQGIINIDD